MNDRFKFRVWLIERNEYADSYFGVALQRTGTANTGHPNIVEMCTGLKDKNSKLIYEGDIVAPDGIALWFDYDDDNACYILTNNDWCKPVSKIACEYEVIGNIHENGDLLK